MCLASHVFRAVFNLRLAALSTSVQHNGSPQMRVAGEMRGHLPTSM